MLIFIKDRLLIYGNLLSWEMQLTVCVINKLPHIASTCYRRNFLFCILSYGTVDRLLMRVQTGLLILTVRLHMTSNHHSCSVALHDLKLLMCLVLWQLFWHHCLSPTIMSDLGKCTFPEDMAFNTRQYKCNVPVYNCRGSQIWFRSFYVLHRNVTMSLRISQTENENS